MEHPIGTRVRINCPMSRHHGKECTVLSAGFRTNVKGPTTYWRDKFVQKVDIPCETDRKQPYTVFKPEWLIPVYDGNELVAWSDCAWQPRELIRACREDQP